MRIYTSETQVELDPVHPGVLHNLARVNVLLSREATEYVDKIMELDSLDSEQYIRMGNDWVDIEDYSKAIMFYEKCLQSDPENCSALMNLANCYANLGTYESALAGYRAALNMRSDDPTIISNLLAMKRDIDKVISSPA